jgi:hypothetical protein
MATTSRARRSPGSIVLPLLPMLLGGMVAAILAIASH